MPRPKIDMEMLIAFAAGDLGEEEARRVAGHVASDPDAARTVALYRLARDRTAGDDSVAPSADAVRRAKAIFQPRPRPATRSWLDVLDEVIARLVYDSRLQPAAVRYAGTGDRIQLTFETDDVDVDLRAERLEPPADRTAAARWRVVGQISTDDPVTHAEIALSAPGSREPVATTGTDDRAMFTLDVEPGVYDLRARVGDRSIVLPGIEIR